MTAPASSATHSPLEATLSEVNATLAELLLVAQEQHAAVVAHDRERIESVTRQQERLSARLARAERQRLQLLGTTSLTDTIAAAPALEADRLDALRGSIRERVLELRGCQEQTASLLARSIDLGKQTLDFLQKLVMAPTAAYNVRGFISPRQSVLVDGRA